MDYVVSLLSSAVYVSISILTVERGRGGGFQECYAGVLLHSEACIGCECGKSVLRGAG